MTASTPRLHDQAIINARVLDVFTGDLSPKTVLVDGGRISGFADAAADPEATTVFDARGGVLLPGLIDSHVHIESSMLSPAGFAALVLPFGTTTVIADPHEMANVAGLKAMEGLIEACRALPLSVKIMVPSCVPALPFEDAGATIDAGETEALLKRPEIFGLGEMMNVPGLIGEDEEPNRKAACARLCGKPIDGHAPLLTGAGLEAYAAKGVLTDHECTTREELRERISLGMYVAIREGSLARNLLALVEGLTPDESRRCTFCTDDRHAADTLRRGHVNGMLAMAVKAGLAPLDAVRMATLNTAQCYSMHDRGAIAPGRRADFVLVEDLVDFKPLAVWTEGRLVARDGELAIERPAQLPGFLADTVRIAPVTAETFAFKAPSRFSRMIGLLPHSLITEEKIVRVATEPDGTVLLKRNPGLVKVAVVERHKATGRTGVSLLEPRYGLRNGAIATSISHDSHNIVVAGDDEGDMAEAVKCVERMQGGIAMVHKGEVLGALPLPVAGLMSDKSPQETAEAVARLIELAHGHFGITKESDAFMTLSFLALPVIPYLKLTTKGLFDVTKFAFVPNDAGPQA